MLEVTTTVEKVFSKTGVVSSITQNETNETITINKNISTAIWRKMSNVDAPVTLRRFPYSGKSCVYEDIEIVEKCGENQ